MMTIDMTDRQRWMAVLARASAPDMERLLQHCAPMPGYRVLRGPEAGLVMTRGRTGAGGAPFHLGEMTVARCSVRVDTGQTGHAYVAGRDLHQVELAALLDGVLQDPGRTDLHDAVIAPLAEAQAARRTEQAAKAAATRVQFFTMQTMR